MQTPSSTTPPPTLGAAKAASAVNPSAQRAGQLLIAPLGRRMLAYQIDCAVVFLAALATQMSVLYAFTGTSVARELANLPVLFSLVLLFNAVHHVVAEPSHWGGTLGKRMLSLQVVDTHGERITRRLACRRFLARLPSILLLGAPYLLCGRGRFGLAPHDRIAKTVVVTRDFPLHLVTLGLEHGRRWTFTDRLCLVSAAAFIAYAWFTVVSLWIGVAP